MASGAGKKKAEIAIVLLSLVIPYLYMTNSIGKGLSFDDAIVDCMNTFLDLGELTDGVGIAITCHEQYSGQSALPFGLGMVDQNFSGYLAFFMVIGLPLFIGLWKWGRKPLAKFLE